jgi:uncharacterized membrane protein YdbT with pleckstrin-like domain
MASYVNAVLIKDETVLYLGHISLWSLFPKIALGVLLLPIVIGLAFLIWAFIIYRTTELAITNKRIIAKFGLISRSTIEINLSKVESIQVDQSVLGRVFNYGTIIVAGAGNPALPVKNISDPLRFRKHFMEATDGLRAAGPASGKDA